MRPDFDAMTPAAAGLPGRIGRNQPEARQDRWMFELERAALADGAATRGAPRQNAAPEAPEARQLAYRTTARREQQPAPVTASPLLAVWQHALAAPPAGLAGVPGAAAIGAPAMPARLARPLPQVVLPGSADARAPLAWMAGPGDDAEAALAGAPAPAPAHEEAQTDDGYARSLLHVYQSEEGVHAYLRDAGLGGDQVRRVASAMAGEFARSGTPLAALTVNGKKIISSGAAGEAGGRIAADTKQQAAPAVQPPTPHAVKGA